MNGVSQMSPVAQLLTWLGVKVVTVDIATHLNSSPWKLGRVRKISSQTFNTKKNRWFDKALLFSS